MNETINNKHNEIMDLGFKLLNHIESLNYQRIYKKDINILLNLSNKIYNLNAELKSINMNSD